MQRLNPRTLAVLAAAAVALLLVAVVYLLTQRQNPDRLAAGEPAEARAASPEQRCASQRTYDVIKRELFRQAAQVRGSDQATYDRLAAYAVVRMDQPVLRSNDQATGAIRCAGRLSLDLPPGVAVVGGRTTLSADIEYVIQGAADGSGDVVMLERADAITIPLATLARSGSAARLPQPSQPLPSPVQELPDTPPPPRQPQPGDPGPAPEPEPAPPPQVERPAASANPSFNCRYARTRGEIAVCNSTSLAALDRQMAAQFNSAMASASPAQRNLLQRTRTAFLSYRDQCPSDACIAETYRGRMREIRDIMAGRWRPPR